MAVVMFLRTKPVRRKRSAGNKPKPERNCKEPESEIVELEPIGDRYIAIKKPLNN